MPVPNLQFAKGGGDAGRATGYLPQQAQTIESISGHTYIRKRISLTLFVKRLILWSEGLFQCFLSDPTLLVCRAVTFFNEIDLYFHNSHHLRNTVKLIRRSSSIIDEYIYPIGPRNVKQKAPPNGRFACLGSAWSSARSSARSSAWSPARSSARSFARSFARSSARSFARSSAQSFYIEPP